MKKLYNHYKDGNTLGTVQNAPRDIYTICKSVAKYMNSSDGASTNISNNVGITRPGNYALVLKGKERTYIFRLFEELLPDIEWYNSLLGCNMKPPISAEAFSMCFFKYEHIFFGNKKSKIVNMVCYSYETLQDAKDWLENKNASNYSEKNKKWKSAKSILIDRFGVRHLNMVTPTHNILIKKDGNGNITALYCDMGSVLITGRQTTSLDTDDINSFSDLKKYLFHKENKYWTFNIRLLKVILTYFNFKDKLLSNYLNGHTIAFSEIPDFETKKTKLLEDVNKLCDEFSISFNKNFSDEFCSTLKCNQTNQTFFDINGKLLKYHTEENWNDI